VSKYIKWLFDQTVLLNRHLIHLLTPREDVNRHLIYLLASRENVNRHLIYLLASRENVNRHGGLQADLKGGSGGAAAPPGNKSLNFFLAVQVLPGPSPPAVYRGPHTASPAMVLPWSEAPGPLPTGPGRDFLQFACVNSEFGVFICVFVRFIFVLMCFHLFLCILLCLICLSIYFM
jgi:hypothetical protein